MSDLLNNVVNTIKSNQSINQYDEQVELIRKTTVEATNSLFEDLLVIYPSFLATIKKNSPEDAKKLYNKTKKMWLQTLMEEKIQPNMIELGLSKCRKSSTGFMPTIGEFVSWCKPTEEDLGIPSFDEAYHEACMSRGKKPHEFSCAIVYEAGSMTGFWELYRDPSEKTRPRFKANYETLKAKLMRGEKIEIITNAIEDKSEEKPPMTEKEKQEAHEAGKAALEELRKLFS